MPAATSVLSDGTIRRLVEEGRVKVTTPGTRGWCSRRASTCGSALPFACSTTIGVSAIDLAAPPENLTELVEVGDGPFVIHPQEFCLGRTLEWVELPDDLVARIEGKALALDTEVPTPDGWTTMGEISAGDWVSIPAAPRFRSSV